MLFTASYWFSNGTWIDMKLNFYLLCCVHCAGGCSSIMQCIVLIMLVFTKIKSCYQLCPWPAHFLQSYTKLPHCLKINLKENFIDKVRSVRLVGGRGMYLPATADINYDVIFYCGTVFIWLCYISRLSSVHQFVFKRSSMKILKTFENWKYFTKFLQWWKSDFSKLWNRCLKPVSL